MAKYSFAQTGAWAAKVQRRLDAVVKDATQEVVSVAQEPKAKGGRMPVDTGFLRNSLMSSLQGGSGQMGDASHIFVVSGMVAGDMATFTWTADYAAAVNNGKHGGAGAHFVEGAADQWQAIVDASVAKAKAAIG